MGAWGPGIFSDDVACDVRDDYRELIGDGYGGPEATNRLTEDYKDILSDIDDGPVFWLALAATQCKCGRLEEKVKNIALQIIEDGDALKHWAGDSKQFRKRQQVLTILRDQLNLPQCEPKKMRKVFKDSTDFKPGDAIRYRLDSGNYAILRVLGLATDSGGTSPIIEVCDWTGNTIPSKDEINKISYRHPNCKGFCSKFQIGRVSKREYPIDRLELVESGVYLFQDAHAPYTLILWREFNETLKEKFSLS